VILSSRSVEEKTTVPSEFGGMPYESQIDEATIMFIKNAVARLIGSPATTATNQNNMEKIISAEIAEIERIIKSQEENNKQLLKERK
jgi:hypothetical protein